MQTNVKAVELRDLWKRYKTSGDQKARDRLVVAYSPLVKYVAGRMGAGLPAHVDEADLISYGLGGLISAIERFDLTREIRFETYAITRIKGAILDELRALDWVPRSVRARARQIERATLKLEGRLQRVPTEEELAGELEMTIEEFRTALLQIANSSISALDELWSAPDSSGDSVSLMDTIQDQTAPDPERIVGQNEMRDRIGSALERLPEREKLVIALYYYENLTLREIGEVLRVTESRVSQLHTKAVLSLRAHLAPSAPIGLGVGTCADPGIGACTDPRTGACTRPPTIWSAHPTERSCAMGRSAESIRNVALVGHRGSGKTSLHEALLFEAGVLNRLGTVQDGTTSSDTEADEQARQMSISLTLSSFEWHERKINLLDTPGEPSFVADALGALRVCEAAIFVVNAVMGAEVTTQRLWRVAAERDIARMLFVNMLDRERADFFRTLESLKTAFGPHVVATEIPIGAELEVSGVIDLVDMRGYRYEGAGRANAVEIDIPPEHLEQAQTYRERLMEEVAEVSDELMERYLEGEAISHEEIVDALKRGTNHGSIFPVVCGVATRNLGTNRLLEAIVDDLPSPVEHGSFETEEVTLEPDAAAELFSYVFKTRADPFAGRINLLRVFQGTLVHDSSLLNTRTHTKERVGQLMTFAGKSTGNTEEIGAGDIGGVAKLKDTRAGDWLAARDEPIRMPAERLPAPVMAFAIEPKTKGDEDKVFSSLRRLQEEDPTIDLHRDLQTGQQIVAGLSQIHVEVIVERLRSRFGAEVTLKPPRVPYQETIRAGAKAHGRHKKQSGGRGQFGDCHIEIEPLEEGAEFEFVNQIKGGAIPGSFIPAVEKGVREAMDQGILAGYPVKGVRVRLIDGAFHTVDSSELAFKLAGSQAMKQALEQARPVLLEPIMLVTLSVPEETVGDVIGDLNSRRGRPQGMGRIGAMAEIKAEVPMAEMLGYAPDLRSITGGQGEYTMEFVRYEEVPAHLVAKVLEAAQVEPARV